MRLFDKLCPFCDSPVHYQENENWSCGYLIGYYWLIGCSVCKYHMRFDTLEEAKKWWNKRIDKGG